MNRALPKLPLPSRRPLRRNAHAVRALSALLGLLLLAATAATASAQSKIVDLQSFYRSDLRALAMGNAFSAVARGEGALLYNPAGLVQSDSVQVEAALSGEATAGGFLKDTLNLGTSQAGVANYLTKYLGKQETFRTQGFGYVVANMARFDFGFGLGKMVRTQDSILFNDVVNPGSVDIDLGAPANTATNDQLVLGEQKLSINLASMGFAVLQSQLLLGVTLKTFTFEDKSGSDTFGNLVVGGTTNVPLSGTSYKGSSYDLGMMWRMETFSALRAQWSLVANNVGGITLQQSGFTTIKIPASYDVGFSINPELPWSPVHLLVAVQAEDVSGALPVSEDLGGGVFQNHNRTPTQRLHMGAELGFLKTATGNNMVSLRLGKNRGLNTTGFELNLVGAPIVGWILPLRILYTRYQDDLGWDGARNPQSYDAAQVNLGFSF